MGILKTMSTDQSLSSLITFDCTCTLKIIMILILAFVKTDLPEFARDIDFCLSLLEDMEQIGFCKSVVFDLPVRLAELGITRVRKETGVTMDLSRESALSQLWPGFDP